MSEVMMDVQTIGRRLRECRERLAMTQGDLAEKAGVGVSSISEFENGKREPTLNQLRKLADAMSASVAWFLSMDEPLGETVRWRERPPNAEIIEARFLKLCRQYRDLERWACEEEPIQLRRSERFPSSRSEVAALARQVQGEMRLGDRPGLVLRRRLEDDYGLKTFVLQVEPSGTAACTASPEYGPAVLLNALNSEARRTFDLAHELFHLLTWSVTSHESPEETEEKFADYFAATLLLPEGALREAVDRRIKQQKLSIANVCELARDFCVSIDALIWRMHNLYGWTDAAETRAKIERARALAAPYSALTPSVQEDTSELPERYRSLAIQALRSGEISTGRFAEYMGLRRWEAMKYADEAIGDEAISVPRP
jgi:Zn-dependent peptidase ImmA (M78 family)/DNA-binding XRE family transcriptional regulator